MRLWNSRVERPVRGAERGGAAAEPERRVARVDGGRVDGLGRWVEGGMEMMRRVAEQKGMTMASRGLRESNILFGEAFVELLDSVKSYEVSTRVLEVPKINWLYRGFAGRITYSSSPLRCAKEKSIGTYSSKSRWHAKIRERISSCLHACCQCKLVES